MKYFNYCSFKDICVNFRSICETCVLFCVCCWVRMWNCPFSYSVAQMPVVTMLSMLSRCYLCCQGVTYSDVVVQDVKRRVVKQLHFKTWPDFGCPMDASELLDFVQSARSQRRGPGPLLTHCR